MEIAQKGGSADLESLKQLLVTMSWNTKDDFDLAALYKTKGGEKGMVYFQDQGDLNAAPWMKLSGDAGVGGKVDAGGNTEQMKITKLDDMAEVHLVVWDYGAVTDGKPAKFSGSDVKVVVRDDKGNENEVKLDTGEMGNVLILAKIDNTDPMGAKLINESIPGTLKGLTDSSQLWAMVEG